MNAGHYWHREVIEVVTQDHLSMDEALAPLRKIIYKAVLDKGNKAVSERGRIFCQELQIWKVKRYRIYREILGQNSITLICVRF